MQEIKYGLPNAYRKEYKMNLIVFFKKLIVKFIPELFYGSILKLHFLNKLRAYSKNNEFEKLEPDLNIIKNLIKPGDSIIDVGANFGFYTFYLSKLVGENGHVFSIEPIPLTFKILSNNVKKLALDNVSLFNCGISEQDGFAIMEIPKFDSGSENYYQAKIVNNVKQASSIRKIKVELRTIDSLLYDYCKKIAFIKIDAENHEFQVINGAIKLISHLKPALFVEVSENPDDKHSLAFELFNLLKNQGYSPYYYRDNKLWMRTHGDKSINYFFLTNKQFQQIDKF